MGHLVLERSFLIVDRSYVTSFDRHKTFYQELQLTDPIAKLELIEMSKGVVL